MSNHARIIAAVFVAALPLALLGAVRVPNLPASPRAVTILNPGTGDYLGFRIVVEPDGRASAIDAAGRASGYLTPAIAQALFSDVAAAAPLASLPSAACSFAANDDTTIAVNSTMIVAWHGQKSPLLACAADPRAVKLLADATTIQHGLYVQAYRTRIGVMWRGASGGGALVGGGMPGVNYGAIGGFTTGAFAGAGFSNGTFTNGGTFNNSGAFNTSGTFSSSFNNGGSFGNGVTLSNGVFSNGGSFSNGTISSGTFSSGGAINNGNFSNGGTFATGGFNENTNP